MEAILGWNVMTNLYAEKLDEVYMRVFGDASVEQELADFFTYEYPGARFTPQYRARLWDGKVRLYDQFRKTLYIGLYDYLKKFCERNNYQLENKTDIINAENISKETVEEFTKWLNLHGRGKPIEIRDYQIDAVHTALSKKRTLLLSPTASGKSLIIYSIMRWHLNNKKKCILVVDDDKHLNESLVNRLIQEDYEALGAFNGYDALKKLETFKADLIVLDTNMPIMGGLTFHQKFLRHHREWNPCRHFSI